MRDLAILFIHLFATVARLMRPSGARAIVGLCTLFIRPGRLLRIATESHNNFALFSAWRSIRT